MNKKNFVFKKNCSVEFQESFNILRTNLKHILSDEKSKLVALTSAKRDCIDSVALNLALSFAQIENNKVLLIDGDMHFSSLSASLGLSNKAGFCECLIGDTIKENCIVHMDGIDILPAGSKHSNPANILDSQSTATFCVELKKCYDYVFIVLPSGCIWSDCAIFAKYTDGFLPVVRHDFTRFKEIKSLVRNIQLCNGQILGFVYNRAPIKHKNKRN